MSLIVRRINRAKWDNPYPDVCADAITLCLKTSSNKLSVWEINDSAFLEIAVLALVTGSKQEKLSTIDVIYFDKQMLSDSNILYEQSPESGDTVISKYKQHHIDMISLTYQSLGEFSKIVFDCITNQRIKRFTNKDLAKILAKAINEGNLDLSLMNQKFIEKEQGTINTELNRLTETV